MSSKPGAGQNVQFPDRFKYSLIEHSLNSVYIVQDCCYKACKIYGVNEIRGEQFLFPTDLDASKLVSAVIDEQGARYSSFLTNFAAGFQDQVAALPCRYGRRERA